MKYFYPIFSISVLLCVFLIIVYLLIVIGIEIYRHFKRKRCFHLCRFCKYRKHCLNLSNKYDEDEEVADLKEQIKSMK